MFEASGSLSKDKKGTAITGALQQREIAVNKTVHGIHSGQDLSSCDLPASVLYSTFSSKGRKLVVSFGVNCKDESYLAGCNSKLDGALFTKGDR